MRAIKKRMAEVNTPRLMAAAKEFNIGTNTLIDFLISKNFNGDDLIVEEHSSVEISKKLNISIHTINLHRKQIMKKLEAKNLAGLIRIYYTSK